MNRLYFYPFFLIFLLVLSSKPVYADSSYVLPYPSSMPGSSLYKPRLLLEKISEYWYFGSFGKFKYNLEQADKYLVEAKTLFEYGQYLLAYNALKKSDGYFTKTLTSLGKAKAEGKDINQNRGILSQAAGKHIEILGEIEKIVPDEFNWQPEKSESTLLNLKSAIDTSVSVRKKYQ